METLRLAAILTDGQIQATNVIFHDFDDIVISHSSNSSSKFTNCIFYNNSFQVFSIYENLTIENCVFFGNNDVIVLNPKGNPHRPMNDSSFVLNSIFFNNTGEIVKHDNFPSEKPKIVSFKYSDIVPEYEGLNNISSDPLFINGTGENFKLDNNSPCINTGHPDSQYNDADGTRNDMGAYGGKYGEWNN